jgi:hypothetical protein
LRMMRLRTAISRHGRSDTWLCRGRRANCGSASGVGGIDGARQSRRPAAQ